jgi:ribosome maturation factor RimP
LAESIRKSQEETDILELCERTLSPLGFRAVDVDFRTAGRSLLRLFIERMKTEASAATGVSIEDCAEVSRTLGPVLDEKIAGAYDLEVSSPGLDRRLRLRSDFEGAVGEEVKLKLAEKLPGRGANLTGQLVRVDKDEVFVTVGKDEVAVALGLIVQAVRVWKAEAKAGAPRAH